jgi:hypothetical protein
LHALLAHVWLQSSVQLLIKVNHRNRGIYLDEVAQHLDCPKPGCRHVGVSFLPEGFGKEWTHA